MRLRPAVLATFIILIPSMAFAQRRGGGGRGARTDPFADAQVSQPQLRGRDLEDLNPLKVLIDKKKDLKLTDEQLNAFKGADEKLKETQGPLLKTIDSLVREQRPGAGQPSEAERLQRMAGRRLMGETIEAVRANYEAAGKEAVATLGADQQAKANELIAKRKEDADKRIRERMGGRGGRGGPPGGGGPPPA